MNNLYLFLFLRCSPSVEMERKIAKKFQIFHVSVCQKVRKRGDLPEQEIANFEVQPVGSVLERVKDIWEQFEIPFGQNFKCGLKPYSSKARKAWRRKRDEAHARLQFFRFF